MSPWNGSALVSLKEQLKLNVPTDTGLMDKLEIEVGGFMIRSEVQTVTELHSRHEKIDRIIELLRGKEDKHFDTFCTILRAINCNTWASELEKKAKQFKESEGTCGRRKQFSTITVFIHTYNCSLCNCYTV